MRAGHSTGERPAARSLALTAGTVPVTGAPGRSAEPPADRRPASRPGRWWLGSRRAWARALPPALAVLPVGVVVVRLVVQRPRLVFGGDQALIELGVRDAVGLHASVGVYSRFGWHPPGPVWLYLLAGPYRLLGGTSWALVVAELMLTAAATVLIVVAAS